MTPVRDIAELEAIYGVPAAASTRKIAHQLTRDYAEWIARSRFCVLATVGPDGTDASPRGDDGPVVTPLDATRLAMPDWRGNNRMDSLRNIVADPRVSLMFMVPGSGNVVRVNGTAIVTLDEPLRHSLERDGITPRAVIVITLSEVYFQCARAIVRSKLWSAGDQSTGLPTVGKILENMTDGAEGGATYDAGWMARAQKTLW